MLFAAASSAACRGFRNDMGTAFSGRLRHCLPDYAPRQNEQYAEDIGDNDDSKLTQSEGGGAVSITYTTNVDIDLSKGIAELYFANPTKSNQDMVLQIVIKRCCYSTVRHHFSR